MKRMYAFPLVVLILLVALGLAACSTQAPVQQPAASGTPQVLPPAEIREYQGEKLDSVTAFHENSISGPQHVDINTYKLEVTGLVAKPLSYTYDEATDHQTYQKVVQLDCVEGWSAKVLWEGVLLRDLLAPAQPLPTAKIAIFYAADGYTSSDPLDYVMAPDRLLAFKMNGAPLLPERGFPFQLLAESKWGYKWVKWVTKIELSADENYKGYWEGYGYSNSGDRNQPFFD
jgi:DMSO/TMAO reductase YedYZ molybdopterin-dependent catalytic subunit